MLLGIVIPDLTPQGSRTTMGRIDTKPKKSLFSLRLRPDRLDLADLRLKKLLPKNLRPDRQVVESWAPRASIVQLGASQLRASLRSADGVPAEVLSDGARVRD
jgi:hypothetical protein